MYRRTNEQMVRRPVDRDGWIKREQVHKAGCSRDGEEAINKEGWIASWQLEDVWREWTMGQTEGP